jgi:hypothetical protein
MGGLVNKNPWLAAVLNLALFGVGTLYVGRRPVVGALVVLGGVVATCAEIVMSPVVHNADPQAWPFLLGGLITLRLGLAVDAFYEARAVSGG